MVCTGGAARLLLNDGGADELQLQFEVGLELDERFLQTTNRTGLE